VAAIIYLSHKSKKESLERKMSNTCRKCSATIPDGRTYCGPHYQQALAEYEQDMVAYRAAVEQYNYAKSIWNSLPDAEKARLHNVAEKDSLLGYSTWFWLSIAALFGAYFAFNSDWKSAAITALLCFAGGAIFRWITSLIPVIGRILRWGTKSVFYALLLALLWFLGGFFGFVGKIGGLTDYGMVLAAGMTLSWAFEIGGLHRASAEPKPPAEPQMPSP
jgi:hypothetical protein